MGESWQPCHVQPIAEKFFSFFLFVWILREQHLSEEALAKQSSTGGQEAQPQLNDQQKVSQNVQAE